MWRINWVFTAYANRCMLRFFAKRLLYLPASLVSVFSVKVIVVFHLSAFAIWSGCL